MRKEQKVLSVSAVINVIVSTLKIWGGLIFSCHTLIADGIYTISDFTTDILAMVGAKIGKKRANKKYPFGYGRFEYIMQIFIGIIIGLVGLVIFISSFFIHYSKPNLYVLFIVLLVILLKGLSSNYLLQMGKNISSVMLISSAKESFIDVISSMMVFFIIIFQQYLPILDLLGCLIIAMIILIMAIKIIRGNVLLLIGEDENNNDIKKELKKIVNSFEKFEYSDSFLIKNGSYYQATIVIGVDEDITVKELLKLEMNLKNKIRKEKHLKIKFIEIEITKG